MNIVLLLSQTFEASFGGFGSSHQHTSPQGFGASNQHVSPQGFGTSNQHFSPQGFGASNQHFSPQGFGASNQHFSPQGFGTRNTSNPFDDSFEVSSLGMGGNSSRAQTEPGDSLRVEDNQTGAEETPQPGKTGGKRKSTIQSPKLYYGTWQICVFDKGFCLYL